MRFFTRCVLPLAFVLAFLSPVPRAEAALTTPQIQAILSVLASFGVDASTVENVRAILEGRPNPKLPISGNQTSYPFLVILSPSSGATIPANGSLDLKWQGLYANSVYVLTLTAADNPLTILKSTSVTAGNAGCSAGLSCSYTWTPGISGTSTKLTIHDQVGDKSGTVSPILFGNP